MSQQDTFINVIQDIVSKYLMKLGFFTSEWHLGKVKTADNTNHIVSVYIDGNATETPSVPCNPDILFNTDDEVWVHFVNRNPNNAYVTGCRFGVRPPTGPKLESHLPFLALNAAVTNATTTATTVGCPITFTLANWSAGTKFYFEVNGYISNASYTAAFRLMNGAVELAKVTTVATATGTVLRSAAITMPTSDAALTVTFNSSSTSGTASIKSARLIAISP